MDVGVGVCVHMYVCMYVCMKVCGCGCVCVCVHVCLYVCMYEGMDALTNIRMHTYVCTCIVYIHHMSDDGI